MDSFGFNPFSEEIQWDIEELEQKIVCVIEALMATANGDTLKAATYAYMIAASLEIAGSLGMEYEGGGIFVPRQNPGEN